MKGRSKNKLWNAFRAHRSNAGERGIPFEFTFDEWLRVWTDSCHLEERGVKGNGYVMARFGDIGPYRADNVEIIRASENATQPQVLAKRAKTMQAKIAAGWVREGDYSHLRDRENHPKGRAVVSPDGRQWANASLCAEELGLTRAAVAYRCRTGWEGWRYQDDPRGAGSLTH